MLLSHLPAFASPFQNTFCVSGFTTTWMCGINPQNWEQDPFTVQQRSDTNHPNKVQLERRIQSTPVCRSESESLAPAGQGQHDEINPKDLGKGSIGSREQHIEKVPMLFFFCLTKHTHTLPLTNKPSQKHTQTVATLDTSCFTSLTFCCSQPSVKQAICILHLKPCMCVCGG